MRDLAVAILGTADSTYNNASDLLDDYFPESTIVYLPSYISSECTGLRVTFDWLKDADIEYVRIKRSQLLERLTTTEAKKFAVIVVGVEGSEDIIISSMSSGIPVFDLTRGLYSVTAADMALGGSVTNAETLSDGPGITTGAGKDLGLDSLTEPQGDYLPDTPLDDVIRDLVKRVSNLEKQMTSERAHVAVGESGWEPSPADILDAAEELVAEERFAQTKEVVDDSRTKYYKSARGKLRRAGKSKARPGETEVWLTDDEAAE